MTRKAIHGFEGFYEASDKGEIFSLDRVTTGKHGTQNVKGKQIKAMKQQYKKKQGIAQPG